jgi:hypothetical protein
MSITDPTMVQHADKPRVVADNTARGLPDDLQRFAKAGLDLKITEFRRMATEIAERIIADVKNDITPNSLADILFDWMTQTAPPQSK